jgi:hypothetical protein
MKHANSATIINVLMDISHTDFGWWETRLAGLCRERPANKLIGDLYFETMVAVDTGNLLVALVRDLSPGGNMNLLFGFTAYAFHGHYKVRFIRHDNTLCGNATTLSHWFAPFGSTLGCHKDKQSMVSS